MEDTAARRYFTCPTQTYHRRYEALRAVIVDGRSQKEVADEFGFQHHSLRQLVYEFRHSLEAATAAEESPFFATVEKAVPSAQVRNR
jgi:transposase-like protein